MTVHNKKTRERITALAVALAAALLSLLATRYFSFLASLENIAADIRIAALQKPMPQSKDIVIAALIEDTVTQFAYRSPIDRAFLAGLLETLEKKGARVIGVDILIDQPTEPDKDALLKRTLQALKTPFFFSYTNTPSIVNEAQLAFMNDFIPPQNRAGANLLTDPFDGTVRWIFAGETNPGMPIGFPRKAALLYGKATPPENAEIIWRARPDVDTPPFPIYPAHTIALLPDEWFTGKIVLVGAVLSITDRHRTPLAVVHDGDQGMMPGIIVQAHGISQLLEDRHHPRLATGPAAAITLALALVGMLIGLLKRGVMFNVVTGLLVIAAWWSGGMLGFSHGLPLVPLVAPTLALALSLWMMDTLIGGAERKQREFVQSAFSRYVSRAVVNQLVDNPEALSIKGERREATFIFTDIAGFTTLSESLNSEKLSDLLNAYLDGACQIILKHEGTIDKFIGDAIMSLFNAPIAQPDHVARAVRCALDLDDYTERFRAQHATEGIDFGITRIGVNTGVAVVGNFGSTQRMDFTALGDTVNIASRTEGANKYFGTRVLCTERVVAQCPGIGFRPVGEVVLKGKTQAIMLYTPVAPDEARSDFFVAYQAAFKLLEAHNPEALPALQALARARPDDVLVRFHLSRVEAGEITSRVILDDK
ncbi:MAG: hypothetical protein RIR70_1899 [Pseudomonadota bacterium]|jgi:class 3 adenylate cyclase/CHASE2 domain-containing sensor protein